MSNFPLAMACAALPVPGTNQLCTLADEPRESEEDTLAAVVLDDADDDADAVIAPPPPRIRLLSAGAPAGAEGVLAAGLALASHARSLERPPRA